jgi:hypothetical protein
MTAFWRSGMGFCAATYRDLTHREILLKNSRSSFENLRTNGARVEIVGDLPFMLSPVEAFLEIFSRVKEIKLETRR